METVTINSEKIKQAIDKYMGNDVKLFEIFVGKSIYSFAKMHFNAVVFDMDKFENIFKYGDDYKEYIGLSLKDSILKKYGEVILYIFEDKIISNPFMAIGVITDGKKAYNEMDEEERQVINSFEGEVSYKKVMNNSQNYILETNKLLALA